MAKDNFIFIGMFGCGKSTIGKELAKELDYEFLDTDDLLKDRYGKTSLQDIVDMLGTEEFMKAESDLLKMIKCNKTVISPGGSAVYYPEAMAHLKSLGKCIYLQYSLSSFRTKVFNWSSRGVVCKTANKTADAIYKEREPLFKRYVDIEINCNDIYQSDIMARLRQVIGY